jgi:hypothetical protein
VQLAQPAGQLAVLRCRGDQQPDGFGAQRFGNAQPAMELLDLKVERYGRSGQRIP